MTILTLYDTTGPVPWLSLSFLDPPSIPACYSFPLCRALPSHPPEQCGRHDQQSLPARDGRTTHLDHCLYKLSSLKKSDSPTLMWDLSFNKLPSPWNSMQPNLSLPHFSQHGTECNQIFLYLTSLNTGQNATKSLSTSLLSTRDRMQPNLSLSHHPQYGQACNQIFLYLTPLNMGQHTTKFFSTWPLSDITASSLSHPSQNGTACNHIFIYLTPLNMGQHSTTSFATLPPSIWDSMQPHTQYQTPLAFHIIFDEEFDGPYSTKNQSPQCDQGPSQPMTLASRESNL